MSEDAAIRRANLKRLCKDRGWTAKDLHAAMESNTYPYWRDLLELPTKSFGEKIARRIEHKFTLGRGWLDADHTRYNTAEERPLPSNWTDTQHASKGAPPRSRGAQAQLVSHPENTSSPILQWGAIMQSKVLPRVFRVVVPDYAMAPKALAGQIAEFTTGILPRPNDGVLVADGAGTLYFREYHARRNKQWEARPINAAYEALDSGRDGLRLMAVLTSLTTARWG